MKIYLASSWRNAEQPELVALLRGAGHDVYDFRNPPGKSGFQWGEISTRWQDWDPAEFRASLEHEDQSRG